MAVFSPSNLIVIHKTNDRDIANQLIAYVPPSWTDGKAKVKGGVFYLLVRGISKALAFVLNELQKAKLQLRILTATSHTLDTISTDYFGSTGVVALPRYNGEDDDSYRHRIQAEILREKVTVNGIVNAVSMVTGGATEIFEPFNPASAMSWGGLFNGDQIAIGIGAYGSTTTNVFQTSSGATGGASPNVGIGGLGDAAVYYTFYVNILTNPRGATNKSIQNLVNRIRAVGTTGVVLGGN